MYSPLRAEEQMTLDPSASQPSDREIAVLAYHLWMERGCPIGSADVDWFHAEAELKSEVYARAATA